MLQQLKQRLSPKGGKPNWPSAQQVYDFGCKGLDIQTEELFRFYYYDCPPYEDKLEHPISRITTDYSQEKFTSARKKFLAELVKMNFVAFRKGVVSFDGWQIKQSTLKEALTRAAATPPESVSLKSEDVMPKFTQKRVDMNIGLDVAWLASKRLVDRIILITADSDFIPAMKFARREGVQIVLVPMEGYAKADLIEHADIIREVKFP